MIQTKEQLEKKELLSDLQYFHCTTQYYQHKIINGQSMNISDGCEFLRQNAECFWLFDIILIQQATELMKMELFQVWNLSRQDDDSWLITCTDGNSITLYKQRLAFSDFPLSGISIYVENGVAILPSEH